MTNFVGSRLKTYCTISGYYMHVTHEIIPYAFAIQYHYRVPRLLHALPQIYPYTVDFFLVALLQVSTTSLQVDRLSQSTLAISAPCSSQINQSKHRLMYNALGDKTQQLDQSRSFRLVKHRSDRARSFDRNYVYDIRYGTG